MTMPWRDKTVQFTADLESASHLERFILHPGGLVTLERFGRAVVTFKPSTAQLHKIMKGKGKLNITTAMIYNAKGSA